MNVLHPRWTFLLLFLLGGLCALAQSSGAKDEIAAALQSRDFHRALALLEPVLRAAPADPELWAMQGAAYAGENEKKEALSSFQHSLRISPNYLPALKGAIQIEYDEGSARAIPLLQRVLRMHPTDTTSHAMLAVLDNQEGNCAESASHFEKAGTLLESQLSAQHAYGACLVRLKQIDKAVVVFQRSLALQPDDPRERRVLAALQVTAHKSRGRDHYFAAAAPVRPGRRCARTGLFRRRRPRGHRSGGQPLAESHPARSAECESLP